jgi:hypothetical protein
MGLILAVLLQAPPPDPKAFEGLDQKEIDAAIEAGVGHLKRLKDQKGDPKTDELVLLALTAAGVAPDDPSFAAILKRMLAAPLEATYNVSLQAMVLEKLDRDKHLPRIYECAQFLADNQCRNGQWSYGQPIAAVRTPAATPKSTGSTRAVRKVPVVPRPPLGGPGGENHRDAGDFSNTQYAALGLRACHDAGIVFPRDFVQRARQAWVDGQEKAAAGRAVATGGAAPRGWGYRMQQAAYGSMTAGAVGALAIYDSILGIDPKRDPAVQSGLAWLASNFTVKANPGKDGNYWHHYFLYGLERTGILLGAERLGAHWWYREGAKFLLENQGRSGAWHDEGEGGNGWGEGLRDTSFAILFLRRATKPLPDVASVDRLR